MIIKVRGTGEQESWRYYDTAREVQSILMDTDEQDFIHPDEVMVERFMAAIPMPTKNGVACVSFIDDKDVPHTIYANTSVYLMDDNGRTIERIN